ncbi:MAG: CapA family protein, partial [Alphaproteobacteria bacterium]
MRQSLIRLRAAAGAFLLAAILAAAPALAQGAKTIRVIGVGDIMMGSDFPQPILHPKLIPGVDPASILGADLAALLRAPDVTFGNFEGTLHTLSKPSKTCRNPRYCYVFRSPPFYAGILKRLGFNLLSMANNHAGDFFGPGRLATYAHLTRAGFVTAGFDKPGYRTGILVLKDGTKVGLIAFGHNPGLLWLTDIPRAARMVRALAAKTDITIVSFHGGAEGSKATRVPRRLEIFLGEKRGDVYGFAHAVIDAGADIVFGHGPHVPRAIEIYRRRFIAYSLGNFWTYGRFNLRGLAGIVPVADLKVDKRGRLAALRIRSLRLAMPGVP